MVLGRVPLDFFSLNTLPFASFSWVVSGFVIGLPEVRMVVQVSPLRP